MVADLKQVEDAPDLRKQDIVKQLERMLEDAKSGAYLSVAYVIYWRGGGTGHGWTVYDRKYEVACLTGEVAALQSDLVKLMSDYE